MNFTEEDFNNLCENQREFLKSVKLTLGQQMVHGVRCRDMTPEKKAYYHAKLLMEAGEQIPYPDQDEIFRNLQHMGAARSPNFYTDKE